MRPSPWSNRWWCQPPRAAVAAGYTAQGVRFDGTNDYLSKTGDLSGSVDGRKGTVSFWFKMMGGDGSFQILFEPATQKGLNVYRDNANKWSVATYNSLTVNNMLATSASTFVATGATWHHLLCSWDFDIAAPQMYIDDVSNSSVASWDGGTDADYANGSDIYIGARSGGSLLCNMEIADFYWNPAIRYDLATESNRRKFISAALKPVDLGSDGSTPTGSQSIFYLSGATASWHINKGTGGGFTATGALTDAGSSPSS